MKKLLVLISMVATLGFAESAPHTHDGFFLNLALGFGYQSFEYSGNTAYIPDLEAKGVASEFDIKLGGRIAPNTLLHATLAGVSNGEDLEVSSTRGSYSTSEKSESMSFLGIGLTYYLPINVFLSGSIGLASFNLQDNGDDGNIEGSTEEGLGFQVAVGKEWWVSDNWGLGVSAAFTYGSAEDKHDAGDASAYGINVMFSATFN